MMNLNLINLPPTEWAKTDWQDAYTQYCKANMFGPKTKKEYYDMVLERHTHNTINPLSDELLAKWRAGKLAAKKWARKHGCDMNGRLLVDAAQDARADTLAEMRDDITDLQQAIHNMRQRE